MESENLGQRTFFLKSCRELFYGLKNALGLFRVLNYKVISSRFSHLTEITFGGLNCNQGDSLGDDTLDGL